MELHKICKAVVISILLFTLLFVSACTVNPATGRKDFTGLMSSQQESSIGASQHQAVIKQYGGVYNSPGVQAYVTEIGQRMVAVNDRQDVQFRFTVLDSPIVNAFAMPGGYIYITRGLLAVANNEAELASVLGHEIGHVAAHHQAARYSQGVLTQLGATVLSSAIGVPAATQAIGLGSNLYMSAYSRDQESQADELGVRYLARAGYDTMAMSDFLRNMNQYLKTEAQVEGKPDRQFDFFSTHPDTVARVSVTRALATHTKNSITQKGGESRYLSLMRGLPYGESASQGFAKDGIFFHPDIGFAFSFPPTFKLDNTPERVAIEGRDGIVMVLDMARGSGRADDYISGEWLKGMDSHRIDNINIHNLAAATTSVGVTINNQPADVRLIAIEWDNNSFVRMQILIPHGASAEAIDDMKRMSYSFHRMTANEKASAHPYHIDLVKASGSDTISSLAREMNVSQMSVEQFAALNGLDAGQAIVPGRMYKVIR